MIVVVDSNVWISALVFGGNPRKVFELIVQNGHTLATSEQLFYEIRRILSKKFPAFVDDFDTFVQILQPRLQEQKLGRVEVKISRDPKDDFLLEMCVVSNAELLVTGDKDLLVLNSFQDTVILEPGQAVTKLSKV